MADYNLFSPMTQRIDPNQQAYLNWQNSMAQAAGMAQNLNPATLAGMALGQALGTWGGWKAGNWWQKLQENLADKLPLKEITEQGAKNVAADNQSVQNQLDWARQQGIKNPQAISLFGGKINPQAVEAYNGSGIDLKHYDFNERLNNPYTFYKTTHPDATIDEINNAGTLAEQLKQRQDPFQLNKYHQQLENAKYPFQKFDLSNYVKKYTPQLPSLGVQFNIPKPPNMNQNNFGYDGLFKTGR